MVYTLSGQGVQALDSGTTRVFVHVLNLPSNFSQGRANPTNLFDVGLLRIGVTGSYGATIPIDGNDMFFDLPASADSIGYSLFGTTVIQLSENAPAPPPGTSGIFFSATDTSNTCDPNTPAGSAGNTFHITAGTHSVTEIRYYRCNAADGFPTINLYFGTYVDGAIIQSLPGVSIGAGWNAFPLTPYPLTIMTTYMVWADVPDGMYQPYDINRWNPLVAFGDWTTDNSVYYNGTGYGVPNAIDGDNVFFGFDVG